ncbi:hypothetical protein EON83_21755 [bacterium]|nr:MAG: hypothetical protein EON83_21755 [bacterium]
MNNSPIHLTPKAIVCRPNPNLWWLVLGAILEVIFFLIIPAFADTSTSSPRNDLSLAIFLCLAILLFGTGIAWLIFELARGEIRADEVGLTWRRGFAGWRSARWEEISDFYIRNTQSSRIVETPQGKLELSSAFVGIQEVVDLVPQRAVNAASTHWGRKGFRRDDEWSVSLSQWSKSQQWTAPLISSLLVSCILLLAVPTSSKPNNAFSVAQWYDAFALVTIALVCCSMGGLFVWMIVELWRERRQAWEHRDETLLINAQGLRFSSNSTHVEARWEELSSIERKRPKGRIWRILVRTTEGDFEFWGFQNSGMWLQFRQLAHEYAPRAIETLQKRESEESLGEDLDGPLGAWSGQKIGEGAQVFSYRSRGNRLTMACISLALIFAPQMYLILKYSSANDENPFAPNWPLYWATNLCAAAITFVMFWWFKRAALWVDETGLQVRSPFHRPRHIRWNEIEAMGRDVWGEWLHASNRKIYITRFTLPLRHAELRQLLEKHVQEL